MVNLSVNVASVVMTSKPYLNVIFSITVAESELGKSISDKFRLSLMGKIGFKLPLKFIIFHTNVPR